MLIILYAIGAVILLTLTFGIIKAMDHEPVRKLTPIEERRFEIEPVVVLQKLTPGKGWETL